MILPKGSSWIMGNNCWVKTQPTYIKLLLSFSLMLSTLIGHALPEDKKQIMKVLSDSADLNQLKHRGIYLGNVEFTQGSTHLRAFKALTYSDEKNQLTLAIAKGSPDKQAHYWTQTAPNKPAFHAYADSIRYYPLKHLIELIGNARVEQGPNSLSGAKIQYDTLKQQVVSQSNGQTRTTLIFYPEKNPT